MRDFKTIDDIEKEQKERQVKEIQNLLKKGIEDWKRQRDEEKKNRPFKDKLLVNIGKGLGIIFLIAVFLIIVGGAAAIVKYLIG